MESPQGYNLTARENVLSDQKVTDSVPFVSLRSTSNQFMKLSINFSNHACTHADNTAFPSFSSPFLTRRFHLTIFDGLYQNLASLLIVAWSLKRESFQVRSFFLFEKVTIFLDHKNKLFEIPQACTRAACETDTRLDVSHADLY